MKKLLLSLIGIIAWISLFAQTPNQFKYQAVLRNVDGTIMAEENATIVISILKSDLTTSIFTETHATNTSLLGLINLNIGSIEDLSVIDWSADEYFLEVSVNGTVIGTSQLLSVPYALQAKTAENLIEPIVETQNLADVVALNNSAFSQIKNVYNPTDSRDVATKAYVDELIQQIKVLENNLITDGNYLLEDIEGNRYKVVRIGTQVWMVENLKTTRYKGGSAIIYGGSDSGFPWLSLQASYWWYDNDEETYKDTYGALYSWTCAINACPAGWHLPSDDEWTTLADFLGGSSIAGGKLVDTIYWIPPYAEATNEIGFSALPGGQRNEYDEFDFLGGRGSWWSSTPSTTNGDYSQYSAHYREIFSGSSALSGGNYWKIYGRSVRCIRDY